MKQAELEETCEVEDVPVSALIHEDRRNRYGSVAGLDDEELADVEELERQVMREAWGPVLSLPVRGRRSGVRPAVAEEGGVDFGAFATVDFERSMPEFDKARYKADKLSEKLQDVLIMLSIVSERLPKARYRVLKYLEMEVIGLEHIKNEDMLSFARLYLKAKRLQKEIRGLRDASWARRRARLAGVLQ